MLIDDFGAIQDPYKNFIAVSRYARWSGDFGRRETWNETVDRYVSYMKSHTEKNYPGAISDDFWPKAYEYIVNHKVMGSMRALMTAGPALDRSHVAGYNCFRGTEKYLTSEGTKSFAETVGTQQDVVGIKGDWVKAEIREFGVQPLNDVRFSVSRRKDGWSKSAVKYDVQVTPDHRWITENRGEVTDLRVGDVIHSSVPRNELETDAFIAGFGFGDGTIDARGRAKVRLCGDKDAEFLHIFEEYGNASIMSPPSYGGDAVVLFHKGYFEDWKQVPDVSDKSPEWISGWIEGYLAADGYKKSDGFWELHSQSQAAIDFVKVIAPLAGYVVTGHYVNPNLETNLGTRKAPLQRLLLSTEAYFRVESVEDSGLVEPVYCAVVPNGAAFALASGMLTGNCSFVTVDHPRVFDEALYILMNGTGLGFSAEKKYVSKLPVVNEHFENTKTVVKVQDSKEGWARGLRELIAMLYVGQIPAIDITALRPAGARLKTFGGRSSGPQPLVNLFDFVITTFTRAAGRQLTPLECHDIMCKIGEVVVVGGVRRSALISLGDLDDYDMAKAKSGAWWESNPQRALANNSAAYYHKPAIGEFMREWNTLYESKSGERGIVNIENMQRAEYAPRRDGSRLAGTNPCLTGDTVIATVNGPRTFAELAETEEDVQVYAWHPKTKMPVVRWMRRPHKTAENVLVLEIEFDSGLKVKATPNHGFYSFRGKRVEARDLRVGQSVKAWSMSQHRDGHLRVHSWDAKRNKSNHQWAHRMMFENEVGQIPEGYVIDHINGDPTDNRIENFQLLTPEQHNSKHYPERFANGFDGTCRNHKVVGIREAGREDVYNGMVEDAHTYVVLDPEAVAGIFSGIVSANCGEISLRPFQFCNLTEVIIEEDDDLDSLLEKVRVATILGTIQSSFTNFRYLRKIWRDNCEEERLLGVSLTGQFGNKLMSGRLGMDKLAGALDELRVEAISTNIAIADAMGINSSTAITTVKPSGTVSQLTGTSSGMHPWHNEFYIRSVRQDNKDPLTAFMRDAGIPNEPDVMKPNDTTVFYFPQKAPESAVVRHELTAIQHLEFWKTYKIHWTEHNPSITVNVREHEWIEVADWVYKNWDIVGGISFLPYSEHTYQQAPYQDTDESGYKQFVADMPKSIDWSILPMYEKEDNTSGTQSLSCTAGQCDLVGSADK